jgi:hypothetical protein
MADSPATPIERLSLFDVSRAVGLHPFEVARILGHTGELPPSLRFESVEVSHLRQVAGVEVWWGDAESLPENDPERTDSIAENLATGLVERDLGSQHTVRADNLVRGLGPADAARARRVINGLIRAGVLRTHASWRGLQLGLDPTWRGRLVAISGGEPFPAELREAWS